MPTTPSNQGARTGNGRLNRIVAGQRWPKGNFRARHAAARRSRERRCSFQCPAPGPGLLRVDRGWPKAARGRTQGRQVGDTYFDGDELSAQRGCQGAEDLSNLGYSIRVAARIAAGSRAHVTPRHAGRSERQRDPSTLAHGPRRPMCTMPPRHLRSGPLQAPAPPSPPLLGWHRRRWFRGLRLPSRGGSVIAGCRGSLSPSIAASSERAYVPFGERGGTRFRTSSGTHPLHRSTRRLLPPRAAQLSFVVSGAETMSLHRTSIEYPPLA